METWELLIAVAAVLLTGTGLRLDAAPLRQLERLSNVIPTLSTGSTERKLLSDAMDEIAGRWGRRMQQPYWLRIVQTCGRVAIVAGTLAMVAGILLVPYASDTGMKVYLIGMCVLIAGILAVTTHFYIRRYRENH